LEKGSYETHKGVDKGDHPPIVPTENPPASGSLSDIEERIYEYVLRNFLGSIAEDAVYEIVTARIKFGDRMFNYKTKRLVSQGFLKYKPKKNGEEAQGSVRLVQGEVVELESVQISEAYTAPPGKITESELLGLMEKYHIGTDASMATHINNIIRRSYVAVEEKSRTLVPTGLGKMLIDFYMKVDGDLAHC
jgi:DNA topoisomerase-3